MRPPSISSTEANGRLRQADDIGVAEWVFAATKTSACPGNRLIHGTLPASLQTNKAVFTLHHTVAILCRVSARWSSASRKPPVVQSRSSIPNPLHDLDLHRTAANLHHAASITRGYPVCSDTSDKEPFPVLLQSARQLLEIACILQAVVATSLRQPPATVQRLRPMRNRTAVLEHPIRASLRLMTVPLSLAAGKR